MMKGSGLKNDVEYISYICNNIYNNAYIIYNIHTYNM